MNAARARSRMLAARIGAFVLIGATAVAAEAPQAKPDSFSAVATPSEVEFGKEVRYVITVHHPKADAYSIPANLDLTPFQAVSVSKARTDKGDQATTDFSITLLAFVVGDQKIPDITLVAEGPQGTRKLVVPGPDVKGVSKLQPNEQLADIKGPVSVWVRSYRLLAILAGALILAILAWLVWRSLTRRERPVAAVPAEPAYVRALRELAAIRAEDLPGKGRKKEMYFRMSEIARRYLGERFDFNAVDLTTVELLARLRKVDAKGLDYGAFQRFCDEADLVKFAKLDPSDADCVQALNAAVSFVESTTPSPPGGQAERAA